MSFLVYASHRLGKTEMETIIRRYDDLHVLILSVVYPVVLDDLDEFERKKFSRE